MADDLAHEIFLNGNYNIGGVCTSFQCDRGRTDKLAMRFIAPSLGNVDYTFGDLDRLSNRFANVLKALDVKGGEVFFTFLPKVPEQFVAFLGALKLGVITGTLFANFGEEALLDRLGDARVKVLLTRKSLLRRIAPIRDRLPSLRIILVIDSNDHLADDVLSYPLLMAEADDAFSVVQTPPETPAVLHYTSGSTGRPKGVLHVHGSVVAHHRTGRDVLDLRNDDVYWCTADQGWVTGTAYGIIAPWCLGITQVHYAGAFDADAWLDILERESVNVWYTAPTALRMLMREESSFFAKRSLTHLRHVCSVGEPLNPEIIRWGRQHLGLDIHDTWFQTETGAIMIANRPGLEIKPGSMGKPVGGIEAEILDADGRVVPAGMPGNLCLKAGWPSMFVTYLNNEEAYRSKFRNGFFYTGDLARRDADGYFWFVGRSDDVINTAGHLVSPFEVESALLEVSEIVESAVVGVPDDLLFEKVVAFVRLHADADWSKELELKIRLHVAHKVSSLATPQEIRTVGAIPKNKSGKILRRFLRAEYLGEDAGDISTMEEE